MLLEHFCKFIENKKNVPYWVLTGVLDKNDFFKTKNS